MKSVIHSYELTKVLRSEQLLRVAELGFRCLSYDRDTRPTMVKVTHELDFIANNKSSMDSTDTISTNYIHERGVKPYLRVALRTSTHNSSIYMSM